MIKDTDTRVQTVSSNTNQINRSVSAHTICGTVHLSTGAQERGCATVQKSSNSLGQALTAVPLSARPSLCYLTEAAGSGLLSQSAGVYILSDDKKNRNWPRTMEGADPSLVDPYGPVLVSVSGLLPLINGLGPVHPLPAPSPPPPPPHLPHLHLPHLSQLPSPPPSLPPPQRC